MSSATGPLREGQSFGARYDIIRLLGMGGMGAVYQARDRHLEVDVALKVILPDGAGGGTPPAGAEERFKRELLLARQITHKNVVRIHDLGEIDGVTYLTMPYLEGRDLASVLQTEKTVGVPRALLIVKQIAEGLRAAHESGVVHRDLKPANVMLLDGDRAVIMDFGIARAIAGDATMTGSIIGTPQYMAPEQMVGTADQRTDLYALGLMLSEMIAGRAGRMSPGTQPDVPRHVADVITRCLAPAPDDRFQTVDDFLNALDAGAPAEPSHAAAAPRPRRWTTMRIAVAAAAIAAIAVPVAYRYRRIAAPPPPVRPVAVAIVPFVNVSGDTSLNAAGPAVAELIRRSMADEGTIRVVSGARTMQLMGDLHLTPERWSEPRAFKQLGEFASVDRVVAGTIAAGDAGLRLEAVIESRDGGRQPFNVRIDSASGIVDGAQRLSAAIQEGLGRRARDSALALPTRSIPALAAYVEGTERQAAAKYADAEARFRAAVAADPGFALAQLRIAQCLLALDRLAEAREAVKAAMVRGAALSESDRQLAAAIDARSAGDADRAIERYDAAVRASPMDVNLRRGLADLLETEGLYDRAAAEIARILDDDPRNLDILYAAGRVAIRRDRVNEALHPLNQALSLAVQLDHSVTKNRVLQALGIAYMRLGKLEDARRQFEAALAVARELRDPIRQAASLGEIAQIDERQGNDAAAVATYQQAMALHRSAGNLAGVATSLNNLGTLYLERNRNHDSQKAFAEALTMYRDRGDGQGEALALSNLAAAHMNLGEFEIARTHAERSLDLRERAKVPTALAETLGNLMMIAAEQGQFDRAEKYNLRAIQLRADAGVPLGNTIAWTYHSSLMTVRGRLGPALQWSERSIDSARAQPERGFWWGAALAVHGRALMLAGRSADAAPLLAEALDKARGLKQGGLLAQILIYQGRNALLRGSRADAIAAFDEALRVASPLDAPIERLRARLYRAHAADAANLRGAVRELNALRADFERRGMARDVIECDLYMGQALSGLRDDGRAKSVLQGALRASERLGTTDLTALIHLSLAETLGRTGDSAAAAELRLARAAADEIRRDGAPQLLSRSDFAALAANR